MRKASIEYLRITQFFFRKTNLPGYRKQPVLSALNRFKETLHSNGNDLDHRDIEDFLGQVDKNDIRLLNIVLYKLNSFLEILIDTAGRMIFDILKIYVQTF